MVSFPPGFLTMKHELIWWGCGDNFYVAFSESCARFRLAKSEHSLTIFEIEKPHFNFTFSLWPKIQKLDLKNIFESFFFFFFPVKPQPGPAAPFFAFFLEENQKNHN